MRVTTVKTLGVVMGGLFLFGGVLGFVPGVVKDGMYLGIFMVNPPHNLMHIFSGIVFLIGSMFGAKPARAWFQIFGTFYALLAGIGFVVGDAMIFGLISNNQYDAWGHTGLALIMLVIGFMPAPQPPK
jgi:hypothetical protein